MKQKFYGEEVEDSVKEEELVLKIPKVTTVNNYIINLDEDIEIPSHYRKVFEILRVATKDDTVTFNINSPGGYIDTMIQFYDCLLNTKAKTIANIYQACSAASVIALCCDEINATRFSYMMIHSMSTGTYGKISDIECYATFAVKQDIEIANHIYSGFISPSEIKLVNKGKELWLNQKEIQDRLKNYKTIKTRFLK
jgi:ATP-dependent protease ClpP protease subunit